MLKLQSQAMKLVGRLALAFADDALLLAQSIQGPAPAVLGLATCRAIGAVLQQLNWRMRLLLYLLSEDLPLQLGIVLLLVLQNVMRKHGFVASSTLHIKLLLNWLTVTNAPL